MNIQRIVDYLDDYLIQTKRLTIEPVEANALLERAGILKNSKTRLGKPLRDLLRDGRIPHAYQLAGKGSSWKIPHSTNITVLPNYQSTKFKLKKPKSYEVKQVEEEEETINIVKLKEQLENSRNKYKPLIVKYLFIAEAPPNSIERFFYYENVYQYDYLFLGIAEAIFPDLKNKFLASKRSSSIKRLILERLQSEGFYLLDLSELPLSHLKGSLNSQIPHLIQKIKTVVNEETRIIIIKTSVYDTVFNSLKEEELKNVIDCRIPFPGQGGQGKFQIEFNNALKLAGYKK
ncbi:MAG TPA: hypothetical protein VNW51_06025 [Mucilaginibacter sp.]|jgi:hypothetical protein|nr:hypothetical protein [Mucilaginibacter sp.]